MSNSKILNIDLNEEYKIKIESPSELNDSFFADIYRQAGEAANDILDKSYEKNNPAQDDTRKDSIKYFKRQNEEYNNIIAFCGDRGTGKSSAMLSFANSLNQIKKCKNIYKDTALENYQFFHIEVIDPSMFEVKESIFEVILAQLFSSFENKLKDNNHDGNHEERRKILELFEKVYDNLKTIQKNGEKYNGEALETLSKLSCGANLRNNFNNLIKNYLDYLKKDKDSKACLIIPIDDFDLNIKAVADMAEQIRKYLMIPKVIILMAADIRQLSDAKEQSVRKDFKTLIDANSMSETPKSITAKYLLKLIPDKRRLTLPFTTKKDSKISLYDGTNNEICNSENIQDLFLKLCYTNYHILFVKPETGTHPIIPGNIRELIEWLIFLNITYDNKLVALDYFNDRFVNVYCENYLSKEDLNIIYLINETTSDRFHKTIIEEIVALFKKNDFSIEKEHINIVGNDDSELINEFKEIINRGNYAYNISLGDILLFLDIVERYHSTDRFKKLIFAIRTLITIRLKKGILKDDDNLKFNSIVAGNILNSKRVQLLPKNRTHFKFSYEGIQVDNFKLNDILKSSFQKVNNDKLHYVDMAELLHYFVSRIGGNENYRKESAKFYDQKINRWGSKQQHAFFDLLSPIYYLENTKTVSERIHNIYNEKDDSLFSEYIQNFIKENYKHSFPFESVELIEYIFNDFDNDYKEKIENITSLFSQPYKGIIDKFDYFKKHHTFYNIDIEGYFKTSPILEIFFNDSFRSKSKIDSNFEENALINSLLDSIKKYSDEIHIKSPIVKKLNDNSIYLNILDEIHKDFDENKSKKDSIYLDISSSLDSLKQTLTKNPKKGTTFSSYIKKIIPKLTKTYQQAIAYDHLSSAINRNIDKNKFYSHNEQLNFINSIESYLKHQENKNEFITESSDE